jgi:hypothetical protein
MWLHKQAFFAVISKHGGFSCPAHPEHSTITAYIIYGVQAPTGNDMIHTPQKKQLAFVYNIFMNKFAVSQNVAKTLLNLLF